MKIVEQAVTRTVKPDGSIELTHPAFCQVSVSRTTGHKQLYGSDFDLGTYITLRIGRSKQIRDLCHERFHNDSKELIEVALSESQWGTLLSSMNMYSGVPCTLAYLDGLPVPRISHNVDKVADYSQDLSKRFARAIDSLKAAKVTMCDTKMSKTAQQVLMSQIDSAIRDITDNAGFVQTSFAEDMEKSLNTLRQEAHAHLNAAIHSLGTQALHTLKQEATGGQVEEAKE